MADTSHDKIASITTSLDRMRSEMPDRRDVDRLDHEMRGLRDQLVGLKAAVDELGKQKVDTTEIEKSLSHMGASVEMVNRKTPPLVTFFGAVGVILTVLGLSYANLLKMNKPITDSAAQVSSAAEALETASAQVEEAVSDITELSGVVEAFDTKISEGMNRLKGWDDQLALLTYEVSKIQSLAGSIQPSDADQAFTSDDEVSEVLAELIGSENLPPYIRLLRDGRKAMNEGQYELARTLLARGRSADPDQNEGVYDFLIGQAYHYEKRHEEAIGAWRTAIQREPDLHSAYNNIGSEYFSLARTSTEESVRRHNLEESVRWLRLGIEAGSDSATHVANLSISLNALSRYPEALSALDGYEGDEVGIVQYQRASTYALMGESARAIDALVDAVDTDRSNALRAASDSDFASLREHNAFLSILADRVPERVLTMIKARWADEAIGSP